MLLKTTLKFLKSGLILLHLSTWISDLHKNQMFISSFLLDVLGQQSCLLFPIQMFGLNLSLLFFRVLECQVHTFRIKTITAKIICSPAISRRKWEKEEITGKACGKTKQWSCTAHFISYFSLLWLHKHFFFLISFSCVPSRPSQIRMSLSLLPTGEAPSLPHRLCVGVTKHVLFACYQDGQH